MDFHQAALDAWHAETPDGPAAEVDWDSYKDCWLDGWETGYRATLAARIARQVGE